jgi:site-specific DNA-methyltransferase (adenine-specific)
MKSERNKTIDLSLEEGRQYLARCIRVGSPATLGEIENRVIVGDTFEVMPNLPPRFADLMIADPPYNLDKDFGGEKFSRRSTDDYRAYTAAWIEQAIPLLKPDASVYVCCDWRSSLVVGPLLTQYFHVRSRITWQREKGRGAKRNWKNGMEDVWFATNCSHYVFNLEAVKVRRRVVAPYRVDGKPKDWDETSQGNFRTTCPSNFWDDLSVPYWSMPENTAHPTQKPEKLMAKIILASSNEGDLVFDPFLGSGTSAVTAKKLGRRFVGIEKNEQYCVWAQKRLEAAETDKTIQGYADGVFWERHTRFR